MSVLDEYRLIVNSDPVLRKEAELKKQRYEISNLLREIRLERNYSQKEIANKSGLTQQMVSKIETYNGTPSLESFLRYCNSIGIDIVDLIKEKYALNVY